MRTARPSILPVAAALALSRGASSFVAPRLLAARGPTASKHRGTMSSSSAAAAVRNRVSTTARAAATNTGTDLATSDRIRQTLDPCVILMKKLISDHAAKWTDRGGIYSLAQGVVYWKPPQAALDAIVDSAANDDALHTYCPDEGLPKLRSALLDKLREENGLGGDGVDVIVTSGANQGCMNCVLTLMSESDKCIVFKPYYFNHVMAVQMTRGEDSLVVGPTCEDGLPDLTWLREQLEAAADAEKGGRIRVVTIVNPGNPTGVSLPRSFLEEAVELCGDHGVWLVMDNTYEHFDHIGANGVGDGLEPPPSSPAPTTNSIVPFWCSSEEHVINIFSFSKAFALAGFRVGYVAISGSGPRGREAYDQMLKVQDTIPICPARVSQIAALASLGAGRGWVSERVSTLDDGRRAILDALGPLETIMGGTGAMYVMGKLPDGLDDQEVANALVERFGVAIIPGSFCGFPGWIRVCYSNLPPEKCLDAASRLARGIKEICGSE